ncbi:MAG: Crp/Fnr family transcriptional regulator [Bdellovibrionales bacterium]|nr:Crp/Fnr family transcriptional regulator [Bdellovibrionales bacterium]
MSGGVRELKKGEILFREGAPSDAMYVIKSGRIAITKAKGTKEIVLAELVAGEMLGEMAFFDNKPRSAGAKAMLDSVVIALPFVALHAQFKTFPEWLKAMVKTVNSHLRNANQRIKNLEQASSAEEEMFPPHTITRLCAILSLVGFKCGEDTDEGLLLPSGLLRNYTIQIFQQPTYKMQKLMEVLSGLGHMIYEEIGEGKQKIVIKNHKQLTQFVDWYNDWIFKDASKKIEVEEKELPVLRALVHYGSKIEPDEKGEVNLNLTNMQNDSMKDLGYVVSVNDADNLAEKGLVNEKVSGEGGVIFMSFKFVDVQKILPFWEIIYTLKKIQAKN